jgi:transposase
MQRLIITNPKRIETQINQFLHNDPESKFIFRLCSLRMFMKDITQTTESLGKILNVSPRTISNWIKWINAEGNIDILRDAPKSGRSNTLSENEMEHLKEQIQKHPSACGLDSNLWDGKTLSHYIKKQLGKQLQVRQCQRLFKKLGFSLKRGRTVVANGDPTKKKAFKKTSATS